MGVVWTFLLSSILSPLSPSLWETARYRLKYCLKGPFNPKQPTNQPSFQKTCLFYVCSVPFRKILITPVSWYFAERNGTNPPPHTHTHTLVCDLMFSRWPSVYPSIRLTNREHFVPFNNFIIFIFRLMFFKFRVCIDLQHILLGS